MSKDGEEKVSRTLVYYIRIYQEKNCDIKYGDIATTILPEDIYDNMNWEYINRLNSPQSHSIIFMSDNRKLLEAFCTGLNFQYHIKEEFNKIYVQDNSGS